MKTHKVRLIEVSEVSKAYDIFCQNRESPWSIDSFNTSVNEGLCLASEVEGELVAYILCSAIFETAEVLDISVKKNVQGIGVGAALMCAAIKYFRSKKLERLMLEVDEHNIPAFSLYKKCGFQTIDTRRNYYRHSDGTSSNALVMSLSL